MDVAAVEAGVRQLGQEQCITGLTFNQTIIPPEYGKVFIYCGKPEENEPIITQVFVTFAFISLMAVAITGNSVVMWIISQHKSMHHGFNYFLFNMALADLLIALFNVGTSWTFNLYYDWWYGANLCMLTSFFGIAPTTVSVFSMMALSWDRCQAVVNPLRKRPLSRRRSLIAIFIIWLISTITALPFALDAKITKIYSYDIETSNLAKQEICTPPDTSLDHMLFVMQYALPLFVLSFTFARIAMAFRSTDVATDNNSNKTSHTRAKSKAIKMLGLMVIAFMFCWLPYHIYHTFSLSANLEPRHSKFIYLAIYWIAMSSSAYNPIIYCFANERFRIGFRYVFRWMPLVDCKKENYEYSQLFPDKMRSMAISLQKGRGNNSSYYGDKKNLTKDFSSAGFTCHSTPDIVQCVMSSEKSKNNKFSSKNALLSCHE